MDAKRSERGDDHAGDAAGAVPPLRVAVAARPGQLVALRRVLRDWLDRAKISAEDASAVQIAVGEASANAVEHAYDGTEPGLIRLIVRLGAGVLSVQVSDLGRWRRSAGATANRGRGLSLIRAVMDDVQVWRRRDGTTVFMRLVLGRKPACP